MNVVFRPQRNLDIKGASRLQQQVVELISEPHPEPQVQPSGCWVVDLMEVNQINHFGLTALVSLHHAAQKYNCPLYLCNLKQSVQFMLEITELDRKFEVLENLDSALKSDIRVLLC